MCNQQTDRQTDGLTERREIRTERKRGMRRQTDAERQTEIDGPYSVR
jgi:hypothetical protein